MGMNITYNSIRSTQSTQRYNCGSLFVTHYVNHEAGAWSETFTVQAPEVKPKNQAGSIEEALRGMKESLRGHSEVFLKLAESIEVEDE
jgi:hypothetical protein